MTEVSHQMLAQQLADLYSRFPQVQAVAIAGSITSGAVTDLSSDIDLYVYTTALVPLAERLALVEAAGGASRADMNLDYWDLGDEWFHAPTGIEIDVMYWDTRWIEETLDRVLNKHQVSLGYSTSHWHTIRSSQTLFDRNGWFGRVKSQSEVPYPEPLRRGIIRRNHSLLRGVIPGYLHQIEKAVRRGDLISVNHRVAALLASYFDILFACNCVLNPGEKRLLEHTRRLCASLPPCMVEDVTAILQSAGLPGQGLLDNMIRLLDHLDAWLESAEPWFCGR
jgi:hypothetical protein